MNNHQAKSTDWPGATASDANDETTNPQQSPLAALPPEIMQHHLLEHFYKTADFDSLRALRETCSSLRDAVDQKDLADYQARFSPIKQAQTGTTHLLLLLENNELYVCGKNNRGQLGREDTSDVTIAQKLDFNFPAPIKQCFASRSHSMVLLENGELFAWGDNEDGKLGLGDTLERSQPEKVNFDFPAPIAQCALGFSHTLVLLENGELFAWGSNLGRQLGLDDQTNRTTPHKIDFEFPAKIKQCFTGALNSMVLLENGELFAWGINGFGQLGLGDTVDRTKPQKVNFHFPAPIVQCATGHSHTIALLANGELFAWGVNRLSQLGKSRNDTLKELSPHRINLNFPSPIQQCGASAESSFVMLENGALLKWGAHFGSYKGEPTPQEINLPWPIKQCSADLYHMLALLENGELFVWGKMMMLGSTERVTTPTLLPVECNSKPLVAKTLTAYEAYRAGIEESARPSTAVSQHDGKAEAEDTCVQGHKP